MGYSHSWYYDDQHPDWLAGWSDLVADVGLLLARGRDLGAPPTLCEVTDDVIEVNGVGTGAYETLVLERYTPDPFYPPPLLEVGTGKVLEPTGRAFGFVKTAALPYDIVVTAVLLRACVRLGAGIAVCSDGAWGDWLPGRDLVAATFGDAGVPERPVGIRESR